MHARRPSCSLGLLLLWAICACEDPTRSVEADPGAPLPGANARQQAAFAKGRALFNRPFTQEEGLGPLFNQDRCSSCHDLPESGGHGAEPIRKATRYDQASGCDRLLGHGGDLFQSVRTSRAREAGVSVEWIPGEADAIAHVMPTPLFGMGLIEAIPQAWILERADEADSDGDGISGRAVLFPGGRVGRFGRKAQHVSLEDFVEEALRLEMGLTTPAHPREEAIGGKPSPQAADLAPEPEASEEVIQGLVEYVRLLAPPRRAMPSQRAAREDLAEGEEVFLALGCAGCHTPLAQTSKDALQPFASRRFRLYSDLLLHDMGPGLATICSDEASPSEWRTQPLIGLAHRSDFLHQGQGYSLEAAILLHGGEAARSATLFGALESEYRRKLLLFLKSL